MIRFADHDALLHGRDRLGNSLADRWRADRVRVPAIGGETVRDVLGEGEAVLLDRTAAVVDPAIASRRCASGAAPANLHMQTVAAQREDVVMNRLKPGLRKCRASQSAAIAIPTLVAIPWPSGPVVVRQLRSRDSVTRHLVELAKALQIVERDRGS